MIICWLVILCYNVVLLCCDVDLSYKLSVDACCIVMLLSYVDGPGLDYNVTKLCWWPQPPPLRSVHELGIWNSEVLTRADSWFQGADFLCPREVPKKFRLRDSGILRLRILSARIDRTHTGVREKTALYSSRCRDLVLSGVNCSPAPDLVLWKLVLPRVFFSAVFLSGHRHASVFKGRATAVPELQ